MGSGIPLQWRRLTGHLATVWFHDTARLHYYNDVYLGVGHPVSIPIARLARNDSDAYVASSSRHSSTEAESL